MFSIIHHSKNPSNTFLRISLSHRSSIIWSCLHVSTSQPSSSYTRFYQPYFTQSKWNGMNNGPWNPYPILYALSNLTPSHLTSHLSLAASTQPFSAYVPVTHEWPTLTFLNVNPNPFVRTAPKPSLFHTFCYLAHSTLTADPSSTCHSHSNPYYITNLPSINLFFHSSTPPTYCSKFNPKTALLVYAVVHGVVYKSQ